MKFRNSVPDAGRFAEMAVGLPAVMSAFTLLHRDHADNSF